MDKFADFVYAALPYGLGFLAIMGIIILVMKLRLRHIENQPKEEPNHDGTGAADRRNNRKSR